MLNLHLRKTLDAYVKYGKNPKTDASMAIYQVEHFRIIPSDGMHVSFNINDGCEFDGTSYPVSPMLQLCDIRDGFLEGFINSKDFRSQADSSDGWYNECYQAGAASRAGGTQRNEK